MKQKEKIHQVPISAGILIDDNTLFREAPVLPAQFFVPREYNQPEKRLMNAVLENALVCFEKGRYIKSEHARRLSEEAREWFFSDDSRWPFSFGNICVALGLNVGCAREVLKNNKFHYAKARGDTSNGQIGIVRLTEAQQMSRNLGRQKDLKAMVCVTPIKVVKVLRALQKRKKEWKEVYNLVFAFLFFCLVVPPQSPACVARYLRCGQTYAHERLRAQFFKAINEREPLFLEALHAIALQCGMDIQALGTLLSRLRI